MYDLELNHGYEVTPGQPAVDRARAWEEAYWRAGHGSGHLAVSWQLERRPDAGLRLLDRALGVEWMEHS